MNHFSYSCDCRLRGSRRDVHSAMVLEPRRRARYLRYQSKAGWVELLRSIQMNAISQFWAIYSLHVMFYGRLFVIRRRNGFVHLTFNLINQGDWHLRLCMCPVLDYLFLVFACMDCYMMCSFKWVAPLLTCRYMFGVSFMFFDFIFVHLDRALSSQSPYKTNWESTSRWITNAASFIRIWLWAPRLN